MVVCEYLQLGDTVGGLLNATFGNAVEIVVMLLALIQAKRKPEEQDTLLTVVQTSLIGSIFSNGLLVLGCAFVANGIYYKEAMFNLTLSLFVHFVSMIFVFFCLKIIEFYMFVLHI